jgi:hypothetical protein
VNRAAIVELAVAINSSQKLKVSTKIFNAHDETIFTSNLDANSVYRLDALVVHLTHIGPIMIQS